MTVKKLITIVIPVFRNQGSLWPSYTTISEELKLTVPRYEQEFIFVDDGSDDNSLVELKDICQKNTNVRVIKFSRNFGQFSALNAGLKHSKGDLVVGISADQQDPPSLISEMVKKIENTKCDIVLGVRSDRKDSVSKNLTARIHEKLIRISVPNYPIGGFDCWMLSRKALNGYGQYNDIIRTNQIDILQLGFQVGHVYYKRKKREIGKSQYNFSKRLKASLNQVLAVSYWPLRLVSVLGFSVTLLGFLFGLRLLYAYFYLSTPFDGYAPIILLQLLIGGVIMLTLGVMGEYQWRIYFEVKKRPLYIIDEIFEN